MNNLLQHIEALIFVAEQPITLKEIKETLEEMFETMLEEAFLLQMIVLLQEKFQTEDFAFELNEIGEGYQFLTKKKYHETVGHFLKQKTKKKLSKSAMESLAIIAYKQPISKVEIEQIRGVNSDYSIQKLLEKELITIVGRSEKAGRPLLYGTSPKFMAYFGIKSLNDLPKPKDFKETENQIGEKE
jgi:segregation and condensation protein B